MLRLRGAVDPAFGGNALGKSESGAAVDRGGGVGVGGVRQPCLWPTIAAVYFEVSFHELTMNQK